jgi:hypothetical protein
MRRLSAPFPRSAPKEAEIGAKSAPSRYRLWGRKSLRVSCLITNQGRPINALDRGPAGQIASGGGPTPAGPGGGSGAQLRARPQHEY